MLYRVIASLVVLASGVLTGCDALDRLTKVEVTATSETQVQGDFTGLGVMGFGGDFVSFDITQTSAFENNNIGRNNIGESYVTRFYLEVISEQDDDLSFINEMSVYFDDDEDHNPDNDSGYPEVQVAYIESGQEPENGQRELYLTVVSDQDIGQYLRKKDLYVHVDASGNPPDNDVTIRAEMDVLVNLQW